MKLKSFLIITAIIYIPFGIGMMLIPYQLFGIYGFDLNADGAILGRVVGAAIVGLGLINYLSRNEDLSSVSLRAILIGNLVYHVLDTFIDFFPTYQGVVNAFTWSFVVLHIVLAIGFAYFLFRKPAVVQA